MKKIIFVAFIFLFTSFLLTGCANKKNELSQNINLDNNLRRPDFGQPDREPDLRGLVKSIVGNEITILKIDRGQGGERLNYEDAEKKETTSPVSLGGSTGRMPGMGGGPGGGMRLSGDAADQEAILERMKEMSTGEEKVLIPVGIQMLKPGASEPGSEPVEASLADIKTDKMIQIWFDENTGERKIANFVMILR